MKTETTIEQIIKFTNTPKIVFWRATKIFRHSLKVDFMFISKLCFVMLQGVVIGAETKKILFLGVKNKFCYVCSKAKNKKTDVPDHVCYKNYCGPSTGMETSIIVEAFKRSQMDYGIIYR